MVNTARGLQILTGMLTLQQQSFRSAARSCGNDEITCETHEDTARLTFAWSSALRRSSRGAGACAPILAWKPFASLHSSFHGGV